MDCEPQGGEVLRPSKDGRKCALPCRLAPANLQSKTFPRLTPLPVPPPPPGPRLRPARLGQVPEEDWEGLRSALLKVAPGDRVAPAAPSESPQVNGNGSSHALPADAPSSALPAFDPEQRSTMPCIYGAAAESEVHSARARVESLGGTAKIDALMADLSALAPQAFEGASPEDCVMTTARAHRAAAEAAAASAGVLELAAAEMASAAAALTVAERVAAEAAVARAEAAAHRQEAALLAVELADEDADAELAALVEEERAQTAAADAAEQSRVEAVAALERAMEHMRATMQQREHALGHARDITGRMTDGLERTLAAVAQREAEDMLVQREAEEEARRMEYDALIERGVSKEEEREASSSDDSIAEASIADEPMLAPPPAPVREGTPACGSGREIILQGFNWESCNEKGGWYQRLRDEVPAIREMGFSAVWLPPPTKSVSPQGYMPSDLWDLDSDYGSEAQLRGLLSTLREHELVSLADIVINHRCAEGSDEMGRWNRYTGGKRNKMAWGTWAICNNNHEFAGTGSSKMGDDFTPAPNVDHTNEQVRSDIGEWLDWLRKDVGYDGWRFDFVKGYPGSYTGDYVTDSSPLLSVGEFWDTCHYRDGVLDYNQDSHRQRTVDWCDCTGGNTSAFDFTTKGILQEAVGRDEYWRLADSRKQPPGVLGIWPSRAVTFLENHDTGSTLGHWRFPWEKVAEGYAYTLTHPGTPCVFWDHLYYDEDIRTAVEKLIEVRRRQDLHCRSSVEIVVAQVGLYAALVDGKVAVKIGPGDWSPNQAGCLGPEVHWKCAVSGPGFAVWEKM